MTRDVHSANRLVQILFVVIAILMKSEGPRAALGLRAILI